MARKTATITIDNNGERDKGKTYFLTEMSASQGENWAIRAFLAIAKSGFDVPESIRDMGMAGIPLMGLKAFASLDWVQAEPLLYEMFLCIQYIPTPSQPAVKRALIEDDIEEIKTRMKLRMEVLNLHTDFFTNAARSISESATAASNTNSSSTLTSPT